MILDARTIALLFIDGLSASVILLLAWIAIRAHFGARGSAKLESLGHLLALAMAAVLFLRIVAWATFFLVLDGYVPTLAPNGVMCAFGVVQLRPDLAQFALWSKPVAVAGLMVWWAVCAAERNTIGAPFQRLRFALVLPIAVIVGAEIFSEVRWLFADKQDLAVSCCRSALDPTRRADWYQDTAIVGLSGESALAMLFASKALLIAACALVARKKPDPSFVWTVPLCAGSVAIAFLDLNAWREVIAPRALGLEFHRCAYELVTRSIALGPIALLAALAHLGLFALPIFALLRSRESDGIRRTGAWIAGAAALAFASELIALAVHVY